MPELPEVETVMRGLRSVLEGRRIANVIRRRDGLRFPFPPDFAARLEGRRVVSLTRRAKYILASIEGGDCLLVHLGMTGRFTVHPPGGKPRALGEFHDPLQAANDAGPAHEHVVFILDDGTRVAYSDARRFGMMDVFAAGAPHKLLASIGVEPLGNEMNAGYLAKTFAGRKAPLKAALLDQRIIAGLGNIYVSEILHRARLSPKRRAGTLVRYGRGDPRLELLVRAIREVLNEAIAAGGSTLQDFVHTDGSAGAFQQRFRVYGREGEACLTCAAPIKRIVQSGRSTFYCRICQK